MQDKHLVGLKKIKDIKMRLRLSILVLILVGALSYFLLVKSPISQGNLKLQDQFIPKFIYPDQDIIGKPMKDIPIIQTKHSQFDLLDQQLPSVLGDLGIPQKPALPDLEGWVVGAKGALGTNLEMIQELHKNQGQWVQDSKNPNRFHQIRSDYDVEWQMENGRAVGLNAYFTPNSNSAQMMTLQSILVGYSSEGWQINWRHESKPSDQLGGLLEMSDGRRIFYVMRFDPNHQGPPFHPMQVYFKLGTPLSPSDFQPF